MYSPKTPLILVKVKLYFIQDMTKAIQFSRHFSIDWRFIQRSRWGVWKSHQQNLYFGIGTKGQFLINNWSVLPAPRKNLGGRGVTPLYKLYRYVPPLRVGVILWVLRVLGQGLNQSARIFFIRAFSRCCAILTSPKKGETALYGYNPALFWVLSVSCWCLVELIFT